MKGRKIVIRADGNARIGVGHLMRCLTIADGLEDKRSVCFLCADEASVELIRERGYFGIALGSDYQDLQAELPLWEAAIKEISGADGYNSNGLVILVDSYYVTQTYLEQIKRFGKVILLDDMIKEAWNVDGVINYNVFADSAMYEAVKKPYPAKLYTGGKYIPVRREFCGRIYQVNQSVKNILITTGGGDIYNIAGQILDVIYDRKCCYHLVTGRFNPYYECLCGLSRERSNIHVHHDVKDMAGLMEQCDLAVTAGGTTIYELCAMGVPFVCFSYAENQEKLTEYIGNEKIAGYGGAYHKNDKETLQEIGRQIEELKQDFAMRLQYNRAETKLVDGMGAARIAKIIHEPRNEDGHVGNRGNLESHKVKN